jgi:hypothetical protein
MVTVCEVTLGSGGRGAGSDLRTPLFPDGLRMRALEVSSRFSAPSSDPNRAEVPDPWLWVKTQIKTVGGVDLEYKLWRSHLCE